MAIQNIAMRAYQDAMTEAVKKINAPTSDKKAWRSQKPPQEFAQTVNKSIKKVNEMQSDKAAMIESFASGHTQNVHELMISLQKAGLAMRMTSAVRNKVMDAYKELSRISF